MNQDDKNMLLENIEILMKKAMEVNYSLDGYLKQVTIFYKYDIAEPLIVDFLVMKYEKLILERQMVKQEYNNFIDNLVIVFKPDVIVSISETWIGNNINVQPSKDPNSKEALMLVIETVEKHFIYTNEIIKKENEKPTLKGWTLMIEDNKDNLVGNMADRMGTGNKLNLSLDFIKNEIINNSKKLDVPIID